jgi:Fic family protein
MVWSSHVLGYAPRSTVSRNPRADNTVIHTINYAHRQLRVVKRQNSQPWPPVTYEKLPWPSVANNYGSRTQKRKVTGPYQAAIPPRIANITPQLPAELQLLTEEAAIELTRFDAEAGHLIAPFASILLRTESASSSEIENITSGAKQIALAALGQHSSRNAGLIIANVRAMEAAVNLAESINTDAILQMHYALLFKTRPEIVNRWRDQQVWIGGGNLGPHNASFVPPHHSHIPELMQDLVIFATRYDLPVITQTAIAHAQFETIHPFLDGNGRTGRALIQSMLRAGELIQNVTVPVSAGLLHNTRSYFDALNAYREGDPVPIVRGIAEASFGAIHNGRILVHDLETIQETWKEFIKARQGSATHKLSRILLTQPVIDNNEATRLLGVSSANAQIAINRFVDAGILTQITDGRRNRVWQAKAIIQALDDFASRARRRR